MFTSQYHAHGNAVRLLFVQGSVLLAAFLITGCSARSPYSASNYDSGSILLLPPRNPVQGGRPHPKGMESGERFQRQLVTASQRSGLDLRVEDSGEFNNTSVAELDAAIEAAERAGTQYVLRLALGEFRNAAPMTFRSDRACLEFGEMHRVQGTHLVWRVETPLCLEKGNIGNHYPLLGKMATSIVASILGR